MWQPPLPDRRDGSLRTAGMGDSVGNVPDEPRPDTRDIRLQLLPRSDHRSADAGKTTSISVTTWSMGMSCGWGWIVGIAAWV